MEKLNLTQEWDKVFPKSDKVDHKKVTFHNRYGITLAADMYVPKGAEGKLPAIAVSGPFGAVKEQSSGLYAQKMAELGLLTIAFDPSYTGESGGMPRYVASPDINTEDFCAAVDFLSVQENVDPERIGIIGICGWGGMALNAAAIDTRIKATAAMTKSPKPPVPGQCRLSNHRWFCQHSIQMESFRHCFYISWHFHVVHAEFSGTVPLNSIRRSPPAWIPE